MKKYSVEEFYGAKGEDLGAISLLGFEDVIINDDGSLSMTIKAQKKHMNMHGTIQGGIQYIICDTAIGAYLIHIGRPGVGMEGSIHYYRPAREGDFLTSTVRERKNGRRTGNYFVELTNQDGKMIAEAVFSTMYD
ncbi:MAG: hotdog fold thioesterase [Eubacteriales bacterium]|nr:hotdog fold thioesterase [Eubacteriales bacterium]